MIIDESDLKNILQMPPAIDLLIGYREEVTRLIVQYDILLIIVNEGSQVWTTVLF